MPTAAIGIAVGVGAIGIGAIGGAALGTVLGASVASTLIGFGTSLVFGGISSFLQPRPQLGGSSLTTKSGRLVSINQSAAVTQVIYGRRLVSFGTLVWADLTGENNQWLRIAGVFCNHDISGVEAVYFDGVKVTEEIGSPPVLKFLAPYDALVFMEVAYGDDDQFAFTSLASDTATDPFLVTAPWNATTDRCRGHAGAYLRIIYDNTVFPNGLPKIEFLVRGKPVYSHGAGGVVWSANGADVVRDYLTNTRFGLGMIFADRVDEDAYIAAFQLCDENMTVPVYSESPVGSTTEKRYEIHAQFETAETPGRMLNAMMSSLGGGGLPYIAGKFHILPAAYRPAIVTLNEDDLIAPISYTSRKSRADAPNTVRGTFIAPERQWKETSFPELVDAAALASDGEEIAVDISLPFTTSQHAAQRLAWIALQKMRLQKPLSITTKLTGYQVQPGNGLAIDFAALGWSGKEFEVHDMTLLQLSDANGNPFFGVAHALLENPSAIYDDYETYTRVPESEPPIHQHTGRVPFINGDGCLAYIDENGDEIVLSCPDAFVDVGLRFAADESGTFSPFTHPAFRVQDNGSRAVYRLSMDEITDTGITTVAYSFDPTSRYLAVLYKLSDAQKFLARLYYLGESGLQQASVIDAGEEIYELSAELAQSALSETIDAFTPEPTNVTCTGGIWVDVAATSAGRLYILEGTAEEDSEAFTHHYTRVRRITGGTVGTVSKIESPYDDSDVALYQTDHPTKGGANRIIDPQLGTVLLTRQSDDAPFDPVTEGGKNTADILNLPLLTPIYHDSLHMQLDLAEQDTRPGKTQTAAAVQMAGRVDHDGNPELGQQMIRKASGQFSTLASTNSKADLAAGSLPAAAAFSTTLGDYMTDGNGEVRPFTIGTPPDFTVDADGAEIITPSASPEANDLKVQIRVQFAFNPTEGKSFSIGAITYTFTATPALAYDVKIGANATATADNLYKAVTDTGTPGVDYGVGTVAYPDLDGVSSSSGIAQFKPNGNATEHIAFLTDVASITISPNPNVISVTTPGGRLPGGIGVNCWRQMTEDSALGFGAGAITAFGVRAELQ